MKKTFLFSKQFCGWYAAEHFLEQQKNHQQKIKENRYENLR